MIDLIEPNIDALLAAVSGTTVTLGDGSTTTTPDRRASTWSRRSMSPGAWVPARPVRPEPRVHLLLGRPAAHHHRADRARAHLRGHDRDDPAARSSLVSFGLLPVRLIGVVLLIASVVFFVLEVKAPGLASGRSRGSSAWWAVGCSSTTDPAGVHVSPWVLITVGGAFVALFFGVAVSKLLRSAACRRAQGAERLVGKRGRRLGAGLGPEGVVRVASEEWRAVSAAGPSRPATPGPRHRPDGLGSRSNRHDEHVPASVPAEGGTTDELTCL